MNLTNTMLTAKRTDPPPQKRNVPSVVPVLESRVETFVLLLEARTAVTLG